MKSYLFAKDLGHFGCNLGLCGHPRDLLKPCATLMFGDCIKASPSVMVIWRSSEWRLGREWLRIFRMWHCTMEVSKQFFVQLNDLVEISVD
jgi:hypothetical protein